MKAGGLHCLLQRVSFWHGTGRYIAGSSIPHVYCMQAELQVCCSQLIMHVKSLKLGGHGSADLTNHPFSRK